MGRCESVVTRSRIIVPVEVSSSVLIRSTSMTSRIVLSIPIHTLTHSHSVRRRIELLLTRRKSSLCRILILIALLILIPLLILIALRILVRTTRLEHGWIRSLGGEESLRFVVLFFLLVRL